MSATSGLEGLLPLDKPTGPSSHDMVAYARRQLGIRKIGHTGTLDPFASGLLLLCLGRATRLAQYLQSLPKEYVATARLGEGTTTDDIEGEVTSASEAWGSLTAEEIASTLRGFIGTREQRPPAYSAKKLAGTRAYARARRGEEVSLAPVPVTVYGIELEGVDLPDVRFRVSCSAGTYVRAIARDVGDRLGVGAHLVRLRRTAIGRFGVDQALSPSQLTDRKLVEGALKSPLEAVAHLPRIVVTSEEATLLESGRGVPIEDRGEVEEDRDLAVALGSRLVAIAVRDGEWLRPRKVFAPEGSDA